MTVERRATSGDATEPGGVLMQERPSTAIVRRSTRAIYTGRANRIVVRHHLGGIVAVIELLSPGNKDSRAAVRDFVEKAASTSCAAVFIFSSWIYSQPTSCDPSGMHKLISDEILEEEFVFPPGKDRVVASYEVGIENTAYVEPVAVGDVLKDMPLFLSSGLRVRVPLDEPYMAAWAASPTEMRTAVETGVLPQDADE